MTDQFEAVVAGVMAKVQREVTAEKKRIAHRCRRMREQILAPRTATEIQAAQNAWARHVLDMLMFPRLVVHDDGKIERLPAQYIDVPRYENVIIHQGNV